MNFWTSICFNTFFTDALPILKIKFLNFMENHVKLRMHCSIITKILSKPTMYKNLYNEQAKSNFRATYRQCL